MMFFSSFTALRNPQNFSKKIAALLPLFCLYLPLLAIAQEEGLTLKQRILMPGPVIEGHAEFEAECSQCHASFEKQALTQLCLDCHEDIAKDRSENLGFHGKSPLASKNNCETCHNDHEGRDADIINLNYDAFNHDFTNFPLEGNHTVTECSNCHKPEEAFRETPTQCFDCHQDDDIHKSVLGEQCDDCHQPAGWLDISLFDHNDTDFMLNGKHQDVSCNACHAGQKYEFTENEMQCVNCHRAVDVHAGKHGDQCNDCHSEDSWKDAEFDHNTETDFPLRGGHETLACADCHDGSIPKDETPQECYACHKADDIHFGRHGKACADCHNEYSWKKISFNHDTDTNFLLTGSHTDLQCSQCHLGSVHDDVPDDCYGCHREDDIHKTEDMRACVTCHNTRRWDEQSAFDHDLTYFPLIGMHAIVPCSNCHQNPSFANAPKQCIECHKGDDVHQESMGEDCSQCHNPNGWGFWDFDHDTQTDFKLEGSHKDLSCDSCHNPGEAADKTSDQCINCHTEDDIHKGSFGPHCDRCHNTKDFSELIWLIE